MCGIAGFVAPGQAGSDPALMRAVEAMSAALAHRGPDDTGHFVDGAAGLALGFRRLSIIDLTATGHQPMATPDGRHVIVFNGELYNYREIRRALEQEGVHGWRGRSDTRSEEHTSELQSRENVVCRPLLEQKKDK